MTVEDGVDRGATAGRVCAGCGHEVPTGRTLCPNCGRVYLASQGAGQPPAFDSVPVPPAQPPPSGSAPAQPTQPPAFGTAPPQPTQPPAFGTAPPQPTQPPAFGTDPAQPTQPFAFGADPAQQAAPPAFGTVPPQPTQPPEFGTVPAQPTQPAEPPAFGGPDALVGAAPLAATQALPAQPLIGTGAEPDAHATQTIAAAEWNPPPPEGGDPALVVQPGEPAPAARPKKPIPVGTVVRSALGLIVVGGLLAAAFIGYPKVTDWSEEMAEPVAVLGTTIPKPTTTVAPTTAAPPTNPVPLGSACPTGASVGQPLTPLPAQRAPAPGQPGQHALLIKSSNVYGNLDLAPGGGFVMGSTPASDAKTVFIVCASETDPNVTGQRCEYYENQFPGLPGGAPQGNASVTTIALARLQVDVYEARSGRKVGNGVVEARNTGCPQQTFDWQDGQLDLITGLDERLVEWAKTHLSGARFR